MRRTFLTLRQEYVASLVEPYVDSIGKPRLIEPPHAELKNVQKRIKNMLGAIEVPNNMFSGIKGRSYADNASLHASRHLRYLLKIDFTAFFPSIKRESVYRFFEEDLLCAPDIAQILTNFTTIDILKSNARDIEAVLQFLANKNVKSLNHLISGAPTSQILSYLANHKMFDEMQNISNKNDVTMSVHVDDVTFSSEKYISHNFKKSIYAIIRKYNYQISKKKVKSYSKLYPKLVTGAIIDSSGQLAIKNSLRRKIIVEHDNLRKRPDDIISRQRLRGLIYAARQVDKAAYPTIRKFAFEKKPDESKYE